MEPDLNVGHRFPAAYTNFNERYYYREDSTSNSKRTALPQRGRTTYDPDCVSVNTPRDSRLSSSTPMVVNSQNLNSQSIDQQMITGNTSRDSGMRGFNFSQACHQLQNSGSFQFATNPEAVKFQGSSCDLVSDWASTNRSITYNQSTAGRRSGTPRLNGANESKSRSVFSKILGGGEASRGIKCIDTRRRNNLAVKQCVRLNEKSMYQDLLNRHLTQHTATPLLPPYLVERHNRPTVLKAEETGSANWGNTSLFDQSSLFSSTKLNETTTADRIKHRLDVSTSILTSAVTTGRGMSSVPLPAGRQTMAERRKQPQTDIPERTLQTLQQLRHQPMRAPPRNEFENQTVFVPTNKTTDNLSFLRKSSEQSDQRRSTSGSPITIESTDTEAGRRSLSKDSEVEVLSVSPAVNNSNHKESLFEKRSPMPETFERSLKESRYAKKEFLLQVNSKTQSDFAKQDILEKETVVKYYKGQREKNESQLINKMQNLLRISERLPVPLEETFIEEEPEEEEICKLIEKEEVEEPSSEFPELTEEQESLVSRALVPRPADQILVEGFKLQITRKDLATLSGLNWLNDEIINFYLNLVMDRSEKQGSRKVYAFSTFFYPKVKSDGHKGVRRWTKSIDLFIYDYVLVPVHLGMHWCLAVVDFRKKQIRYYDSMGGSNEECLRAIRNYLSEECQAKRQMMFDWNGWQFFTAKDIPQQMNGSDCGMFTCKFAEYISRDAAITFDQRNMPYFRRRMVYEILTKTLM